MCGGGQFINLPIEASSFFFYIYSLQNSSAFYERANSFISKPVSTGSLILPMIHLGDSVLELLHVGSWKERFISIMHLCVIGYSPPFMKILHLREMSCFIYHPFLLKTYYIPISPLFCLVWYLIKTSRANS